MPDHIVSGDVDSMLRSANDAAIRSAIGVGTTDSPTFSTVTGTNLAATANVYLTNNTGSYFFGASSDTAITRDGAAGILAQRNVAVAQALRVYNSTDATPATNYDRGVFDFKTTTNTLRIGTENGGTYTTARPIDFVTGGVVRMSISAAGTVAAAGTVTAAAFTAGQRLGLATSGANAVVTTYNDSALLIGYNNGTELVKIASATSWMFTSTVLVQFGGTTDVFPAIARDGAGIKFTGANAGSTSWIKVPAVAVSALPAAATAGVGARSFVNDALTPVFGNAVAGAGLSAVPVYSDGTNWNVG